MVARERREQTENRRVREAEKECVNTSARRRDRESQGGNEIVRVSFVLLSLIYTHTVSPSPVYTRRCTTTQPRAALTP